MSAIRHYATLLSAMRAALLSADEYAERHYAYATLRQDALLATLHYYILMPYAPPLPYADAAPLLLYALQWLP